MGDRDTERLIDAWLDGELPPEEASRLEAGLRCDPALRREYGPTIALLRSREAIEVPPGLRGRVVSAVHERVNRDRVIPIASARLQRASHRLRWLGAVAASVVLFMGGWYGSQWWAKPGPTPVVVAVAPTVTDPWVAAACVQSLAGRGPLYPTPFVVQGAMMEMLAEGKPPSTGSSAGQGSASPGLTPPKTDENEPIPVPLLPIIQRL